MTSHRELLRLAVVLSTDSSGYPRWVSKNRAISTAYYALFHAVAELCAKELVANARQNWRSFKHIYRSLEHGHAKNVFRAVPSDVDFGQEARSVANTFIDLQERRHEADYNPGSRPSSGETKDAIERAERALELVNQLPPYERRLLASLLIGRSRR